MAGAFQPSTDAGLLTSENPAQGEQITGENQDYDELVDLQPGLGPPAGNEEPDEEEQAHYDSMYADFMEDAAAE
jgi:hypothetical protein